MPITHFTRAEPPFTRTNLNDRFSEIAETLDNTRRIVRGSPYSPFQVYGKYGSHPELRASQAYLTKFPAALVDLLFPAYPSAHEPEHTLSRAPTPRQARSQAYAVDAGLRSAIEQHAVDIAVGHYTTLGATSIEILGKPYDLRVVLDGMERHIEVKGSTGADLGAVFLTPNEVEHARGYQPTDLFVVDNIVTRPLADGSYATSGGLTRKWTEWKPAAEALSATQWQYMLPTGGN